MSDSPLLILPLPGNEALAEGLAAHLSCPVAAAQIRPFPDGETCVRIDSDVADVDVVLACTLDRPDERTVPLLLAAATARDLGARSVGLVAPYLAYMRQDARFHPGEGVSARYYAEVLSGALDWLVTVDPHLHRIRTLEEVFRVPTRAVSAAPAVAEWISARVAEPLVVGPDAESAQWVHRVASRIGAPHVVLQKERRGDRDVIVSSPERPTENGALQEGATPVLLDDIVSTGRTMAAAALSLQEAGLPPPVCVGVHAVFTHDALDALRDVGVREVATCNTIPHPTNAIDVTPLVAAAVAEVLAPR